MSQSFDETGAQFAWDSTSLKLAQECPRKYQYVMLEGWQSPNKSVHLLFGGWYASALEHFHKHRALGMSVDEALFEVVREAMIETWEHTRDEAGERIPETGSPWRPAEGTSGSGVNKTRENLIRTIVWYIDELGDESITRTYMLSDGKPAVEHTFTLPVDNDIIFSGHIDRLVEYSDDIYCMDQKTTGGTISIKFFSDFDLDIQMSMYTFAGKAIYNIPVKGVIIDGAQIAVGFTRFARGFTFRSDDQLSEWYDEMHMLIERTRLATQRRELPRNLNACGNYGGCQFRGVCSKPRAFREQFLRADFVKGKRWDPLERR